MRDAFATGPGPASPTGSRSTPTARAAPGRSRACRAGAQAYLGAFTGALDVILLVAAGVALAGAIASLVLIRRRDTWSPERAEERPAARREPAVA